MSETFETPPAGVSPDPGLNVRNHIFTKLTLVALIFGLLQIPLLLIMGTISEREKFNVDYPQEYKGPGAGRQTLTGPVLTVPYRYQVTEERPINNPAATAVYPSAPAEAPATAAKTEKITKTLTGQLHFFPDTLAVNGALLPEIRDGGKFKSIVYATDLNFQGVFRTDDFASKKIQDKDILWKDAYVTLGISDLRGISRETTLDWSGQKFSFKPGPNGLNIIESGQHVALPSVQPDSTYKFAFTLPLKGSRDLSIFPAGKENRISLSSTWNDPQFTGGFLPSTKSISKKGFDSTWNVSYFTRNFPQVWTDKDPSIKNSMDQYMVGVTLATPVDFYQAANRALKYGSLFIIMTFLTFFVFEVVTKVRVHEFQYLMVGLALSLFFLVLIALSEWIPFVTAYMVASLLTVVQITWYTHAFSKNSSPRLWKIMAASLTALYGYLYVLLQLESFSLLAGALGLFAALSVVLYTTRNINWYNKISPADEPDGAQLETALEN